jgi:Trk K+ transport system NAD-binding subunit
MESVEHAEGFSAITESIHTVGEAFGMFGVAIMVIGISVATILFITEIFKKNGFQDSIHEYKIRIGRAMLLSLEVLIAADIVQAGTALRIRKADGATMPIPAWFTIILLAAMFALLIKSDILPVAIFLGALTFAIVFHLTPLEHGLKGFSNPGVLTIGALLMVSAGMNATGAVGLITDRIFGRTNSVRQTYIKLLPPVAVGSAFLDNATVVPMLIPSLRNLCRRKRLPASKLFLPLSYAAILGGATTLIGTPANLIIAGLVTDRLSNTQLKGSLMQELHLFDPAWIGLPVAIFGIGIIFLLGQRLLPEKNKAIDLPHRHRVYRAEFRLRPSAPPAGQKIQAADLTGFGGAELISFTQTENIEQQFDGNRPLRGGDILAYKITGEELPHLWKNPNLIPLNTIRKMDTRRHTHQFVEVAAAPTASVIGRKVSELSLLNHPYKMAVVAMSRQGRPLEFPLLH